MADFLHLRTLKFPAKDGLSVIATFCSLMRRSCLRAIRKILPVQNAITTAADKLVQTAIMIQFCTQNFNMVTMEQTSQTTITAIITRRTVMMFFVTQMED